MTLAALVPDLITASRLEALAREAGAGFVRLDRPDQLPPAATVRVLLVDWGSRDPAWAATIRDWRDAAPAEERPDIILFGPHTDLAAHAAAREAGLGPMRARSALFAALPGLLRG